VLACTHFPLLGAALQAAAPDGVAFIDSGRAVAERVRSVLDGRGENGAAAGHAAYFTQDDAGLRRRLPGFAARGFALGKDSFPDWG
jgi:glutamate racemase